MDAFNQPTGLEKLLAWQKSMKFARRIYQDVIPLLPREEKWVLSNQLRRAVYSVPANIAEGYGRFYFQEGIRFSYIARGSLYETLTFLSLARDINYLSKELFASLREETVELARIISGYIAYLKKSKPGFREPGVNLAVRDDPAVYAVGEVEDNVD